MSITGAASVWPNYSALNTNTVKENTQNILGQEQFLKILIAQLRHQDPLQPMEDRDFIAQMAQFSSVEHMMGMSNEIKLLRQSMGISSDLIGKNVSWYDVNASGTGLETFSGTVEAITFNQGLQFAVVAGKMIPIDELIKIWVGEEPIVDQNDGQDAEQEVEAP